MPEVPPPVDEPGQISLSGADTGRSSSVNSHDLLVGVAVVWGAELALGTVAAGWMSTSALEAGPEVILTLTLASNAITFFIIWGLVCRKYGKSFLEGFALEGMPPWTVVVWAVFGVVTAAGATVLIATYANDRGMMADMGKTLDGLTAALVLAVIVPPFEEFYYRGFIQPALNHDFGTFTAVLVTAVWFGVAHSYQLLGNWVALTVVATMGLVWSLMRAKSRSLLPPLAAHWCYNITIAIIQIAVL